MPTSRNPTPSSTDFNVAHLHRRSCLHPKISSSIRLNGFLHVPSIDHLPSTIHFEGGAHRLSPCLLPLAAFDIHPTGGLLVFEVVVDFIFMFDVGLSFRTTVVDPSTKETVTDVRKISAR